MPITVIGGHFNPEVRGQSSVHGIAVSSDRHGLPGSIETSSNASAQSSICIKADGLNTSVPFGAGKALHRRINSILDTYVILVYIVGKAHQRYLGEGCAYGLFCGGMRMCLAEDTFCVENREQVTSKVIKEKLAGHLDIAEVVVNTAISVLSNREVLKPLSPSQGASAIVLCRMISDIRCIYILAEKGYSQQAATLMCTIRETAQQIVIIGGDDSMGEMWLNHKSEWHSFPNVGRKEVERLFKAGLQTMRVPSDVGDSTLEHHESINHKACMSKHANPIAQMIMTWNYEDGTAEPNVGPMVKRQSIELASSTLFHTTQFTLLALWSFAFHHMHDDDKRCAVLDRIVAMWEHLGTLQRG